MVSQLSETFNFLENLTKEDLAQLKKEMKQIMDGEFGESPSELCQQVPQILENFKNEANRGQHIRDCVEAREVVKICAGCGGLIHGKSY